jgi:ABC-type glycerol-3-phosphate transport system substrate-binding protein
MTDKNKTLLTRRSMLGLLGAAGGLGVLSACAPSALSSSSGNASSGSFEFTAWSFSDASTKAGLTDIVNQYQTAHKSKISTNGIPYNSYESEFILQAGGGELTGAAQMDIGWLGAVAALGKLEDLSSVASKGGYTSAALTSGQVGGTQYGLPWTTASIGIIANQTMLDKVGAKTLPQTTDEFVALLTELKGTGVIPYAASTEIDSLKDIEPWIWTFGGTIIDNGKVTLGDEGSVNAVAFYKSLYDKKLIAPGVDRNSARNLFAQGKTAMYEDSIGGKGEIAAATPDKNLPNELTPVPRPVVTAGSPPQAVLWGHVVVVFKGDGSADATEFASWITSNTNVSTEWYKATSYPPATTAGLAVSTVADDKYTSDWSATITKTAKLGPFWKYTKSAQMDTALATAVQSVLIGQASPKAAMQQAASDIKSLMD